jgi:acyl-CoA thioesterase FadM
MARAIRAPRLDLLDTETIRLDVRRSDVEATRMNNGRYLTLMDLGRLSLIARTGYLGVLAKRRWFPLVISAMIRFKRSLRVGTTFELSTRVTCWDERSWFLEQWFEQRGERQAHAFVKCVFRGPSGVVSTSELLAAGRTSAVSPPFPEAVCGWMAADAAAFRT